MRCGRRLRIPGRSSRSWARSLSAHRDKRIDARGSDRGQYRRQRGHRQHRYRRGRQDDPNAPPRKNNGITGDARKSTAALGKMAFDIKIDYAVKQIQGFLGTGGKTTAQ